MNLNLDTLCCPHSPEPEIQWLKVIGNFDLSRTEFKHHELIIKDVRFEDAGEYLCKGSNGLLKEPKEEIFNLNVQGELRHSWYCCILLDNTWQVAMPNESIFFLNISNLNTKHHSVYTFK